MIAFKAGSFCFTVYSNLLLKFSRTNQIKFARLPFLKKNLKSEIIMKKRCSGQTVEIVVHFSQIILCPADKKSGKKWAKGNKGSGWRSKKLLQTQNQLKSQYYPRDHSFEHSKHVTTSKPTLKPLIYSTHALKHLSPYQVVEKSHLKGCTSFPNAMETPSCTITCTAAGPQQT